eukprot:GHVL01019925.1.p1 GENE.GHVL01019925.1~~GHVL01019925.1.p1  ORF type:complete len:476 (-),score=68.03 GHVL01019925.1:1108-2535(-)
MIYGKYILFLIICIYAIYTNKVRVIWSTGGLIDDSETPTIFISTPQPNVPPNKAILLHSGTTDGIYVYYRGGQVENIRHLSSGTSFTFYNENFIIIYMDLYDHDEINKDDASNIIVKCKNCKKHYEYVLFCKRRQLVRILNLCVHETQYLFFFKKEDNVEYLYFDRLIFHLNKIEGDSVRLIYADPVDERFSVAAINAMNALVERDNPMAVALCITGDTADDYCDSFDSVQYPMISNLKTINMRICLFWKTEVPAKRAIPLFYSHNTNKLNIIVDAFPYQIAFSMTNKLAEYVNADFPPFMINRPIIMINGNGKLKQRFAFNPKRATCEDLHDPPWDYYHFIDCCAAHTINWIMHEESTNDDKKMWPHKNDIAKRCFLPSKFPGVRFDWSAASHNNQYQRDVHLGCEEFVFAMKSAPIFSQLLVIGQQPFLRDIIAMNILKYDAQGKDFNMVEVLEQSVKLNDADILVVVRWNKG